MQDFQKVLLLSAALMLGLVFLMPDIEYDSFFRMHIASDFGFSFWYLHSLLWLPIYQFLVVAVNDLLALRLLSVVCIILSCKIFRQTTTEFAAFLFALNPLILLYGSLGMSESLSLLLFTLFLYAYRSKQMLLSQLVLAVGCLNAYIFWILVPVYLAYQIKDKSKKFIYALLPILMIGLWLWINLSFEQDPLHFLPVASSTVSALSGRFWFFDLHPLVLLSLFPLIYPLGFVSIPFLKMPLNKGSFLYSVVLVSLAALTIGVGLGYIVPWARYMIFVIPCILILGSKQIDTDKNRNLLIALYFWIAVISMIIQAQILVQFKELML